jgi:hypothetical protein
MGGWLGGYWGGVMERFDKDVVNDSAKLASRPGNRGRHACDSQRLNRISTSEVADISPE